MKTSIEQLLNDFLKWSSLKKEDTFDGEKRRIMSLKKGLEFLGINDPYSITENDIFNLIVYFRKTGVKNSTINTRLILLYSVFKKAKMEHLLPNRQKLYDDTTSFQKVTDDDLDKILIFVSKIKFNDDDYFRIKCAIYLMLESGVRANELRNIRISNIDVSNKRILLTKTKNYKKRIIPFSILTSTIIDDFIFLSKGQDYLFWDDEKNAIWTHKKLHYWLTKIKVACNIDKLHCHQFRKNFATKLNENGCALSTISKLLGHSSLMMTQIYLDMTDNAIFNDYEKHQIRY